MIREPLVSVILPVYNGERFLEAAIRSVYAQDTGKIDLIVIDDGSTDRSAEIAKEVAPDARLIRQENAGPPAARNRGLVEARGEYVSFIDCDDEWPLNKLALQVPVLDDDDTVDVALGMTRCLLDDGTVTPPRLFMQLGCALFRPSAFDRVGRFDESFFFSDDVDWFVRAREGGLRLRVTDDVTLRYRLHEGNLTRGDKSEDMGRLRIVKRSLDRRRTGSGGKAVELPPL